MVLEGGFAFVSQAPLVCESRSGTLAEVTHYDWGDGNPIPTLLHQIHRLALKLTMMPSVPVPVLLSTYCQELLHVIKSNRCVTSYDPAKQGLVVHYWHVVITSTVINYNVLLTLH